MKKAIRIPAIVLSVIVIGVTLSLSFANSYQQPTRTQGGRCGLSAVSEDRSFYNAGGAICIGQPLNNYKRKSCAF